MYVLFLGFDKGRLHFTRAISAANTAYDRFGQAAIRVIGACGPRVCGARLPRGRRRPKRRRKEGFPEPFPINLESIDRIMLWGTNSPFKD